MGTENAEIERLFQQYDRKWFRRESPQHSVKVPSFFMSKTPITQDQWRTVVTQVGKIARDYLILILLILKEGIIL